MTTEVEWGRAARFAVMACVVVWVVGCGSESTEPDDPETLAGSALPESATLRAVRVDVGGTNSAPRIERARLATVAERALAVPSLSGDLVVVGYSAQGSALTAMPFSLPTSLRVERAREGSGAGKVLPLAESRTSLLLHASSDLERIEVLGGSGEVLASLDAMDFETPEPLDKAAGASPRAALARDYPSIEFLGPGDDLGIALDNVRSPVEEIVDIDDLVQSSRVVAGIREALAIMPVGPFSAVRTVALARLNEDVEGITFGSTVVLNELGADISAATTRVMIHEATHAYAFLVDGGVSVALFNRTDWPEDVQRAARQTVSAYVGQLGLVQAWDALHLDAVEEGFAGPYLGDDWRSLGTSSAGDQAAAERGFATAYGSKDPEEDLCEYVAMLVTGETGTPVCGRVRSAPDPFPLELSPPYVKSKLLEGLALASEEQVRDCVGTPSIEGPPGIHLGNQALADDLNGGFITLDGTRFLGVLARTGPWQMLIRLRANEDQPRGVYRLDNLGYYNVNSPTNGILLGNDMDQRLNRTSARGLVLVSEYGPDRIAGALFFLQLRGPANNVTDSYSMGTFRVDDP